MKGDLLFLVGSAFLPIFALMAARALQAPRAVSARTSWLRQLARDLLLVVAAVSAIHLCAELYYRFVYDATDGINVSRVSQRWFERHWQRNAQGYRDDVDYAPAITPGRRRVTFVGDSVTAAQGIADVGDRFANILRKAHPAWEVEVIAKNGANTDDQIEMLEKLAARGHDLDVVVLVYAWNDIRPHMPERIAPQRAIARSRPPGLSFVMDHGYAFNTLYYRLKRATLPRGATNAGIDPADSPYRTDVWEKQRATLAQFFASARRNGAKQAALVAFPRVQDIEDGDYAYGAMHQRLAEFASEEDIPYLDLLPPLLGLGSGRALTLNRSDDHPNALVHAEVAAAIARFLEPLMVDAPR